MHSKTDTLLWALRYNREREAAILKGKLDRDLKEATILLDEFMGPGRFSERKQLIQMWSDRHSWVAWCCEKPHRRGPVPPGAFAIEPYHLLRQR